MSSTLLRRAPRGVEASAAASAERRPVPRSFVYLALGALLADVNLMLGLGVHLSWIGPAIAFATMIGIPTFLLYGANPAGLARGSERLAISVVLGLGLLMVAALAMNTLGPPLRLRAPLGDGGAIATVDAATALLAVWAWPRHPKAYPFTVVRIGTRGRLAVLGGAAAIVSAVLGANRLNNGAGAGVTLTALGLVLVTFAALLAWRNQIEPGTAAATIYLLSTALLLMTSLRGWYTTGHDVQREFQVFELTHLLGRWDMSRYQDGYNACLSITILPTIIARWTRVADPYVFKLFFQLLFGVCPVLVYHLARRFVTGGLALVATIYFVAFPTFLQDMPFLNRQEIALLFLTAGLLCLFNPCVDLRRRKQWFCVLAVGMVLSHYSTTYVTIAVLLSAAALRFGVPRARVLLGSLGPRALRPSSVRTVAAAPGEPRARSSVLGLGAIGFVMAVSLVWTGPVTRTSGGITHTVSSSLAGLSGREPGSKSSDTSYSLFSPPKASPARLLDQYRLETRPAGEGDVATAFDPATTSSYPTPVVTPPRLPATRLGALVPRLGVNLPGFNGFVRQGSARLLQLFIVLGLLAAVFARRPPLEASADLIYLGAANLFVLGLQVLLPALSVEYGLLRAFQESLLVLDVFLVVGSLTMIPRTFGRWRSAAVALVALGFLASSTGVGTQLLGGYEPQLHLNNSGPYYDLYYLHPQELAAAAWLRGNVDLRGAGGTQAVVQADRFTFPALQTLELPAEGNDIFPTLVRRDAYVLLGSANVRKSQSTVSFGGDLITYRYPIELLDTHKDLLYSTAGSRVYR